MTSWPLSFIWTGDSFIPIKRHAKLCDERYVVHERYELEVTQGRSTKTHNHEFAWLAEAWASLPEKYQFEPWAQSTEHLRKKALISTGFCTTETFACGTRAEAMRWASILRSDDEFALISLQGTTIHRFRALSQSKRAMGAKEFQRSKTAVIDYIANLLEVPAQELERAEGA